MVCNDACLWQGREGCVACFPASVAVATGDAIAFFPVALQVAPEQGQLLSLLVELLGVQSAIEVGVFTGYSSLAVALALPPGGRLVAFDRDASSMEVARTWVQGLVCRVQGVGFWLLLPS